MYIYTFLKIELTFLILKFYLIYRLTTVVVTLISITVVNCETKPSLSGKHVEKVEADKANVVSKRAEVGS